MLLSFTVPDMPSSREHKEKADLNRATLSRLIANNEAPEWMAVVAFYTAMHLVERLAACENIHHSKHPDRLAYLTRHKQHRSIHVEFQTIFDASLVARYGTANQFAKAYIGDAIVDTLVNKHLKTIETYVDTHFNPSDTSTTSMPVVGKTP
jgi:hypothetical protein